MRQAVVEAIGGRAAPCPNTRVVFCKDTFDYPELEDHELLCNHLGNLHTRLICKKLAIVIHCVSLFFVCFESTEMEGPSQENA